MGEAVASYWEKVGVRVSLVPTDFAAVLPDIRKGGTPGSVWFHRLPNYTDYEQIFTLAHSTGSGGRFPMWHDDTLTKSLDELAKLGDAKAREAKMRDITRYNYDNFSIIPITVVDDLFGMSKKIGSWPALERSYVVHFEWITHAKPLGTFRLFTP